MVFGLFKKQPTDTGDLLLRFHRLKSECPATAYMFAKGFKIAFGYAQVPGASKAERQGYVTAYYEEAKESFKLDRGARMIAARAIAMIAEKAPNGWSQFPIDGNVVEICDAESGYRSLTTADKQPATGHKLQFLKFVGVDNVAEFVELKLEELDDVGEEEREIERMNFIAICDIFDELDSGRLVPILGALNDWKG